MDAGNWSLKLSGSHAPFVTTLIDNSGKKFSDKVGKVGRVFDVVSGSLNLGTDSFNYLFYYCFKWTRIW